MKETLKHCEAFEYYYSLGAKRNFKLVESKFKVSNMSVARWSKAFNWQERIEQRDIGNAKKLEAKIDKAIVNSRAEYRTLIKKVVREFEKKLKAGKIRIDKPEDLSIMAKLDLLMMGEATEKQDVTYKLLDTDISKYPKAKNAIPVQAKDNSAKKDD